MAHSPDPPNFPGKTDRRWRYGPHVSGRDAGATVFLITFWDWRTFAFDRDLAYADAKVAVVNANEPNLKPFKARNGKLVMYHGWADSDVPPEDGIRYHEAVERAMGGRSQTQGFLRLFMVPAWDIVVAVPARTFSMHSAQSISGSNTGLRPTKSRHHMLAAV